MEEEQWAIMPRQVCRHVHDGICSKQPMEKCTKIVPLRKSVTTQPHKENKKNAPKTVCDCKTQVTTSVEYVLCVCSMGSQYQYIASIKMALIHIIK